MNGLGWMIIVPIIACLKQPGTFKWPAQAGH